MQRKIRIVATRDANLLPWLVTLSKFYNDSAREQRVQCRSSTTTTLVSLAMDEADALEALANTLTLLTENPYDISLHAQNVRLARATGMEDQLEAALGMVTTFWAAGNYVWLPLIDMKANSADLAKKEDMEDLLALFERAEEDYLCKLHLLAYKSCRAHLTRSALAIPLLKKHLEFIIAEHTRLLETGTPLDDLELFSIPWMLVEMDRIVRKGEAHVTEVRMQRSGWNRGISYSVAESGFVELAARAFHGAA